jgi:signal transduction histidine kinase
MSITEKINQMSSEIKSYFEHLNQENHRLSTLLDIAKQLGGQTNFDGMLQVIIDQACKLVDADRATIFIVDYKENELWSRVGTGLKMSEIRFPMTNGIASLVVETKKTLRLEDAYAHVNFNKEIDSKTGYRTKALVTIPMINSDSNVIGVFQIINKKNGVIFDDNDVTILEGIASISAVRLENILLLEELKLNERLSTIGKFTSGISHEIKNLLTPLSFVELIPKLQQNDPKIQKYCNIILQTRNQIVGLLNEIRETIVQDQKFETVAENLGEIISDVATLMRFDNTLKNCTLNEEIEENLPKISLNQGKIKQVLINLIRNAAQAMPSEKKGEITIKNYIKGDKIYVEVKDNGVGIPPENLNQIWKPFFSTKKDVGTGFGLDICKKIIGAHGAKITCESTLNVGTTFKITFNAP